MEFFETFPYVEKFFEQETSQLKLRFWYFFTCFKVTSTVINVIIHFLQVSGVN